MLTRPLPPFRDRPIHDLRPRPAPLLIATLAAPGGLRPLSIKAERKSVKGLLVATVAPKRVRVRAVTRLG